MSVKEELQAVLRLVESDLDDSQNLGVVARYPHLGSQPLIEFLRGRVRDLKLVIQRLDAEDSTEQPRDKVVEAVRADLLRRSQLGIQKYGMTLERTDLSLKQWLQHAYEETLDQANYLKRAIIEIEKHQQE